MKVIKSQKLLYFIAGAFILLNACKKKSDNIVLPDQIGNDAIEPFSTDTFTLLTSSIREDSILSNLLPYKLLGAMNDPNFGLSKANLYSQFTITSLLQSLNADPNSKVDSVVLTIRLTSATAVYGNLASIQSLEVHELNQDFPSSANPIYSNLGLSYDPTAIATYNGSLNFSDSIDIRESNNSLKIAPSIRLKLSTAFANKLFTAPTGTYSNDATFKNFFKGIAIIAKSNPSSSEGGIIALTPDNIYSRIAIYYNDSMQYNLNMAGSRSFSEYQIVNQPNAIVNQKTNSNLDYNQVYLQSMTGAKVKITMPYLENLAKDKNIIIHKAELIVNPLGGSFNTNYYLPQRLLVLQPDDNGYSIAIPDLFTTRFNGNLTANNNYVLNVTEFLQFQLNNYKANNTLKNVLHLVIPSSDPIAPSRMIIDAQKATPRKISLKITYSKL